MTTVEANGVTLGVERFGDAVATNKNPLLEGNTQIQTPRNGTILLDPQSACKVAKFAKMSPQNPELCAKLARTLQACWMLCATM
jgi:hypothetical protein